MAMRLPDSGSCPSTLGTGGDTRSKLTIRNNTWVDGGRAFEGFPGLEWDCVAGKRNLIERNVAIDPDGGFALAGSPSSVRIADNIWGTPGAVTLAPDGNCTSPDCNPQGQPPIGYRKPTGVHW